MAPNHYAAAVCLSPDVSFAVTQCCVLVNQQFAEKATSLLPDLVIAFVAGYQPEDFNNAMNRIGELTSGRTVLGVTCQSLIAGQQELENTVGISLWSASWPAADVTPMFLQLQSANGNSEFSGLPQDGWKDDSVLIMLSEAYSFPADGLLEHINTIHPGVRIVGGVCDSGIKPSDSRLMLNGDIHDCGAVAVRISGVTTSTVVSQGCRPIGDTFIVTDSERNIVGTLGGQPSLDVLKKIYATLPTQDQSCIEKGLHLGIAMTEMKDEFQYGDFLIRNVNGIDEETDTITIGDYVRKGRTVQFHLRDHVSASIELRSMLELEMKRATGPNPAAALIFTCNGRGSNLFEQPHHDAALMNEIVGDVATAGFFAAGEFGYVGSSNFLHGFTASIALFH